MGKTVIFSNIVPMNSRFLGRDRNHRHIKPKSTYSFDRDTIGSGGSGGGDGRRFPLGTLGGREGDGVIIHEYGEVVDGIVPFGRFFGGDEEFVVVE